MDWRPEDESINHNHKILNGINKTRLSSLGFHNRASSTYPLGGKYKASAIKRKKRKERQIKKRMKEELKKQKIKINKGEQYNKRKKGKEQKMPNI